MWHHKGWFRGGWWVWILLFMLFSGFFDKAGIPGFVIPLVIFWIVASAFSGGKPKRVQGPRPRYRPEAPPQRSAQVREPANDRTPAPSIVVETASRSLAGLPGHCKSCGGPVDLSTVEWRGSYAACGFCGSGLK